jgi:Ca2+-binding RTX toxin-like protein/subtilisin-like proprotein convertase family protein
MQLEVRAMLTPVTHYHADFSDAGGAPSLDGFTIDNNIGAPVAGLWHLSTGRGNDPGHSSDDSMYFGTGETSTGGGNYDVGHTAGRITSSAINNIPAGAVLSFNYLLQTENAGGFDVPNVFISANSGAFNSQSITLNQTAGGFQIASLDLSAFRGQNIQVRFEFNTADETNNGFEGWYVDDVMVTTGTRNIQGTVFNDVNDNDLLDGDQGFPDTRVFIDDNDNGLYDTDYFSVDGLNATPVAIPDNTTVTSTITISGTPLELVRDVNVTLNITHTYNSDLDVFLIAPNGTRVELFTDVGDAAVNFTSTTLDDEASSFITSGTAPYTGTFRPEGSLAVLDGIAIAGTWTLEITDDSAADIGTLNSWSLQLGVTRTFQNTTINLPIPNPGTITSPINVSGTTGFIQDIDVQLNILHFAVRDLDIFLIAPNGVRVELVTDAAPDTGSHFSQTIFDDEAATAILDGSAPFTGRFRPEGLLSALDGYSANGTWQLEVTDDTIGFTGTLNNWSLALTIGERTDFTDAFGNYDIPVTEVGNSFRVRQATPPGFIPTAPSTGMQLVTVAPEVSTVAGVNFGNQRPDFRMISATGDGGTGISVTYEITNGDIAPIAIDIFQSSDALLDGSDTFVTTLFLEPADRTVGIHTVNLVLGVDIILPGAGIADLDTDYRLLFTADSVNLVEEPDVNPLNEDNTVAFTGVYHQTGGPVMAFGFETADTFTVTPNGLNVEFDFNNASMTNPLQTSYPIGNVTQFRLRGAGGDDNFTSGANNDTMSIPLAIWGGAGLDTIQGGDGNDSLFGGADNDLYVFFPSENVESDTVEEAPAVGRDTVDFSQLSTAVTLNLGLTTPQAVNANRTLTLTSATGLEDATGGSAADTLTGNSLANILTGNSGDDVLSGGHGSDTLNGGGGNDRYVFGGATVGGETDTIVESPSLDSDTLDFSSRTIAVTVNIATGTQQQVHTDRQLILGSGLAMENVIGGSGVDTLTGNSRANVLTGNAGHDILNGGLGSDTLNGGAGNDRYVFGGATVGGETDTISEASSVDSDTLDFSSRTIAVTVNIATGTQQQVHTDRQLILGSGLALENVIGGSGVDTLTGNSRANVLTGNVGHDILNGGLGSDILDGGAGNDRYVFGSATSGGETDTISEASSVDSDTLEFSSRTIAVTVNIATGAQQQVHTDRQLILGSGLAIENVIGGSSNDSLTGNSRANTLTGNAGNDVLNGGLGSDFLIGGPGSDRYVFGGATAGGELDTITELSNLDQDTLDFSSRTIAVTMNISDSVNQQQVHTDRKIKLSSGLGIDIVLGGSGDDTLTGNSSNNVLVGNGGKDKLTGNSGRDILIGGLGLDTLSGGNDDDILISGRTTHDATPSSLGTLLTGWISGSPYATRVAALKAGVGSPAVTLIAKTTALNDSGEKDSLTGGSGTDWYFKALDEAILDLFSGEIVEAL